MPPFNIWTADKWPPRHTRDEKYTFLAAAVEAVGRHLYPLDWTDSDPISTGQGGERFKAVQEWLAGTIARNELPFVLFPESMGEPRLPREQTSGMSKFGASDWNVADISPLFLSCQMPGEVIHPEWPVQPDWIYVSRDALEALVRGRSVLNKPFERKPSSSSGDSAPSLAKKKPTRPEIQRWFISEFLPVNPKQPPGDDIYEAAKLVMPQVNRAWVREVVKNNWPEDWSEKPGPKGPRSPK